MKESRPRRFGQDLVTASEFHIGRCHFEGHSVDEGFEPPSEVTTVARLYRPNTVLTQAVCGSVHEFVKVRQTRCAGGDDPPEDIPFLLQKGQNVE